MNFLAHIYLSGNNDFVKIGNFMADGIRGKSFETYPLDMQKGILLHRKIDTFTDAHPVFRQSTKRLHHNYHHYSGVIVDIFYDHFLAKNWTQYSDENLSDFINHFYQMLQENQAQLNPRTRQFLPYMLAQNWLLSYATLDGLEKILTQMDNRTQQKSKMKNAIQDLKLHYSEFETEFFIFFKEMITFTRQITQDYEIVN